MTPTNMQGNICLVTGSTRGLGKAVAVALAQQHATVMLGCRDRQRGQAVLAEIKAASPAATVDLLLLDLSVQHSVRSAVREFESRYDHLDVLINNAAVFTRERTLTADGYETMFATNHLGPFLLTNLLLPRLEAAAAARILTVTAPSTTKIAFDDVQGERKFSAIHAFGASKAANLLFTYELARRLAGTNVTVNAFFPGLVKTSLMREAPVPLRWLNPLFGQSPESVAQSLVYYASAPGVQGVMGMFFNKDRKSIGSSPYTRDREIQRQLWEASIVLAPLDEVARGERIHGENI
jgi:NAD(P)-dependent dehydrogenase (short-subunit alcohol dehydrogenase family)